jgi:hypothetical protein
MASTYPPRMTQIGHHDDLYRSTPLEQKLAWFQNAPGLTAIEPARQFMSGAAALYTDSDAQVRTTLRSLGADWTGDAATNAGATLQRAAEWSQGASAVHGVGGETVEGYGRSFESLRGQVHWDDPWAWGWNDTGSAAASVATLNPAPLLSNLTADYFTTAQQNRTNDATAIAALRAHEEQTRTAVDSFPNIAPPGIDPAPGHDVSPGAPDSVRGLPTPPTSPAGGGADGAGSAAVPVGAGLSGSGVAGVGGAGGGTGGTPGSSGGAGAGGPGSGGTGTGGIIPGPAPGGVIPGGTGVGAGRPGGVSGATPGGVGSATPGRGGATPGGVGRVDPGGRVGETVPGRVGSADPGRVGGATPGGVAGQAPGSDPRLRGGGGVGGFGGGVGGRDGGPLRLPTGAPLPGDEPGRLGVGVGGGTAGGTPGGTAGGTAGGWRDVVSRPPSEPGLISRSPAAGPEFASRLPSGAAPTEGAGMPLLGGMGVGAGAQTTSHRNTYWVRSAEPFDVPLPPHGEGVLHGDEA